MTLAVLLVGLNAASYVQKEKVPDSETNPNRSTYNAGATGTRAFFDLLAETGRRPARWQEPPLALARSASEDAGAGAPQTFVVVGPLPRPFTDEEVEHLMRWVAEGGRLVVIDREPRADLLSTAADWSIKAVPGADIPLGVDPSNQVQMTDKAPAAKPVLPSIYTRGVNAVQPSRFASWAELKFFNASGDDSREPFRVATATATPDFDGIGENPGEFKVATPRPSPVFQDDADFGAGAETEQPAPPPPAKNPPPKASGSGGGEGVGIGSGELDTIAAGTPQRQQEAADAEEAALYLNAPVVHLAHNNKPLLVDFPYGAGEIVYLSDPYIVSNAGLSLVDNAQLAINVVAAGRGGTIAFDEFHHGYGAGENRLLAYFAGTPVPAIVLQILLLVGFALFTQSRRFARPLPANEPNRLSKLEYVAAMAALQQRTRAYDLALENIYSEFRRTTARFVGANNFQTPRQDLARMIAEKGNLDGAELEELMSRCEDVIHGAPAAGKKEVLHLAGRLREIEEKLGLKRSRQKQIFRK